MAQLAHNLKNSLRDLKENERVAKIISLLPPLNFITVHYSYFIITCMVVSVIFWGSSEPTKSVSYTDSLFLVVSAMTEAGLNTVNLSQITTFQQVLLWLLIVIGSSIFVSISTVHTRKRVFENRLKHVVKLQKEARRMRKRSMSVVDVRGALPEQRLNNSRNPGDSAAGARSNFEWRHSGNNNATVTAPSPGDLVALTEKLTVPKTEVKSENEAIIESTGSTSTSAEAGNDLKDEVERGRTLGRDSDHISSMRDTTSPTSPLGDRRFLTFVGVNRHLNTSGYKLPYTGGIYNRANRRELGKNGDEEDLPHWQYPNYLTRHTTGRNAQFFGLSKAEREHLGGVEYRAITFLSWIVPLYFTLWQLLGCLGLGAYMAHNKAQTAEDNGINPWWLGIFNGVSAFNNSGMSLLDLNMIPFQTSTYTLITMGILILAGNTAYPLLLRLIIWSMFKLLTFMYPSSDQYTDHKATLRFIINYPRRVYTNLFPSAPTWWLFLMLVMLNGIDWVAFELLNIGNSAITSLPTRFRVLDGLFQALAVRSGGFYAFPIPSLRIGLQVLYVIMMYISVYPVVITMRHSNVYEERSLGIYADGEDSDEEALPPKLGTLAGKLRRTLTSSLNYPFPSTPPAEHKSTGTQFIRQQIRGQLAHDLWWLAVAVLLISCIEVGNFERDPVTYSVFNIMFEVVSGYGCVGISTGLPNEAYSFSGGWHVCSKLVLCAVMLRGRHRGLPVALDRAVRLPGGEPGVMEEEDQMVRSRSMSVIRTPRTPYSARSPLTEEFRVKTPMTGGSGLFPG